MSQKPSPPQTDETPNDTLAAKPVRPAADPATFSPERIRGEWAQLRKRALLAWPHLSDHDFTKVDGSADKLYELIGKRYGGTRDEIVAKLDSFRRT